jgi:RND family efflux transporter MFP subunit
MKKTHFNLLPIVWALVAVGLVGGIGYGVWSWQEADRARKEAEIPDNLLAKVSRRTIENRLLLTGEIAPAFSVEVKSEISGRVESIHVRTGETVLRGQPLVTIDDTDLLTERARAQTEIDGARLEVDKRRGNFERARALYEEKLISKEVYANLEADLLIAENNFTKAEAQLQGVEDKLSKTRLLAPADGTVLSVNVSEGQVVVGATSVNAGNVLMNFADLSRLIIQTHVNQMDIGKINEGEQLQIVMPNPEDESLPARIEFIAPVASVRNNIKGFSVEALIEKNDPRLRPGMSVSLNLPLGRADSTVSVPIAAVFRETGGKRFVWVRQGGGRPERRSVVVGLSNYSFAEILEGVSEGEEILLVPPRDLSDQG